MKLDNLSRADVGYSSGPKIGSDFNNCQGGPRQFSGAVEKVKGGQPVAKLVAPEQNGTAGTNLVASVQRVGNNSTNKGIIEGFGLTFEELIKKIHEYMDGLPGPERDLLKEAASKVNRLTFEELIKKIHEYMDRLPGPERDLLKAAARKANRPTSEELRNFEREINEFFMPGPKKSDTPLPKELQTSTSPKKRPAPPPPSNSEESAPPRFRPIRPAPPPPNAIKLSEQAAVGG